jgi:hypothetical protein
MNARTAFSSRSSFTLVEMLTAIVVLSLLMAMIFSMLESMLKISDSTSRGADSSIEAKQVLDRIGADINAMLIRSDVDQFYYSGDASAYENDKMFFYSQQTGFFDSGVSTNYQSPVSLIGYRINTTDTGVPVLERLTRGLICDLGIDPVGGSIMDPNNTTGPLVHLTFPARTSAATFSAATDGMITKVWGSGEASYTGIGQYGDVGSSPFDNGSSPYYGIVGPDVFRFQVCFLLQNGTFSLNPGYINSAPSSAGIGNTVAIVVAIAVLDSKSRKLVQASKWNNLIAALPNPTATAGVVPANGLMDSVWNSALNSQSTFLTTSGIPVAAASHIKVYQRYYYLNAPKVQ